jgi:hypothetical protein
MSALAIWFSLAAWLADKPIPQSSTFHSVVAETIDSTNKHYTAHETKSKGNLTLDLFLKASTFTANI